MYSSLRKLHNPVGIIHFPNVEYHARTFKMQQSCDKSGARDRLTAAIQEAIWYQGTRRFRVLSLPGCWWHFEKNLQRRFGDRCISFTSLENSRS